MKKMKDHKALPGKTIDRRGYTLLYLLAFIVRVQYWLFIAAAVSILLYS
jgi:hypothetical protein